MEKIIHENGNNAWLCNGTPHCFVRRDFIDTYDGILPCKVVEPIVQQVLCTDPHVNVQVDLWIVPYVGTFVQLAPYDLAYAFFVTAACP